LTKRYKEAKSTPQRQIQDCWLSYGRIALVL
jgi:hypothetical protein